jgi:hypothetical protein
MSNAPQTPATDSPPRWTKHDGVHVAEHALGQPDPTPAAEPTVRFRVKRDQAIAAVLPDGTRLHLAGDGSVHELPTSIVRQLEGSIEVLDPEPDLTALDGLADALAAQAKTPGALEKIVGRMRAKLTR